MEPRFVELRFDAFVAALVLALPAELGLRRELAAAGLDRDAALAGRLEPELAEEPLDDPLPARLRGLLGADLLFAILISLFSVGNCLPGGGVPAFAGPNRTVA